MPVVPDSASFDPALGAHLHTGDEAVTAIIELCRQSQTRNAVVALDTETPGLVSFDLRCVTAAWKQSDGVHAVLLDPMRVAEHRYWLGKLLSVAAKLVLHNCFSGDTELITRNGVRRFSDVAGTVVEVWSDNQWLKAEARCYGTAPVRRITVRPARCRSKVTHTLEATGNHRWPLVDGRLITTDELQPGDLIQAAKVAPDINVHTDAFRHGLIFADGSLYTNQPVTDGIWGYQMRLCGAKARWVHLFDNVTYPPSAEGDPVVTGKLPFNPKALPVDADAEYIAAFVHGWQLLDGSDFGQGREVTTVDPAAAEWLVRHAAAAGWYASGHSTCLRKGGYKPGVSHRVVLTRGEGLKPVEWRVVEVGEPSEPVPVYCVEVPGIERFTLAQGIYTGNSPFDVPRLWHHGLIDADDIGRITDTLVTARLAHPDEYVRKGLSDLTGRYLDIAEFADGLKLAFKAAGYPTLQAGYENMDIDVPIYRLGAMADTVATLRLLPEITAAARRWLTDHPFVATGATTDAAADRIIDECQRVNRVMLRRTARGIAVDRDHLSGYLDRVADARELHTAALRAVGLGGGAGKGAALVAYLDSIGELPSGWPRTPTGKLSSQKKHLDALEHPLSASQRALADFDKVETYLGKVMAQYDLTGRCHPQVGILGASATGRMSLREPALQQFNADARGILCADGDALWSVDWSQIEPVVLGNMAGGTDPVIASYEAGDDLYEPVMRSAGIDRKTAKVVVLAGLYGQGIAKLARTIGHTEESAMQVRRQMQAAMPASTAFMRKIEGIARRYGQVLTLSGRILPVHPDYTYRAVNHVVQGSAADQLHHAVLTLEDAGLGDTILVAMHDELVLDCDEATSKEVEHLMQTPHPGLLAWSGRSSVRLRTDRESSGRNWTKC